MIRRLLIATKQQESIQVLLLLGFVFGMTAIANQLAAFIQSL